MKLPSRLTLCVSVLSVSLWWTLDPPGSAHALPFIEYQSTFPEHWNDAWSDSPTGFRISLGSITTTEMYMLYDLKVQKDVFSWWQLRYRWRFLSDYVERHFHDDYREWNSQYGLLEGRFKLWQWVKGVTLVYPTYSKFYTSDLGFGLSLDPSWSSGRLELRAGYLRASATNYTQRAYDRVDASGQPVYQRRWEIQPFYWELTMTARVNNWIALDWINVYRHERYRTLNLETDPVTLWALTDDAVNRYRLQLRVEHPEWPVARFELIGRGRLDQTSALPMPRGATYREVSLDYARDWGRIFARGYSGFRRYRQTDTDTDAFDEKGWQVWLSRPVVSGIWGGARYEHRDNSIPVYSAHRHSFCVTGEKRFDGMTLPEGRAPYAGWSFRGPSTVEPPPQPTSLPPLDVYMTFTFIADEPGKTNWSEWDRLYSINFQTRF